MATAQLAWVKGGGSNSIGQRLQYKLSTSGSWITVTPDLGPDDTTYDLAGLADNTIYDFRLGNICGDAVAPQYQAPITKAFLTCPAVTYTPQATSLAYSFPHLGGDVSKYVIELLNAAGNTVLGTQVVTAMGATISGTFTGLTASTSYQVRITVYAGSTYAFSKTCPLSGQSTSAPSPCNAPTGVTATMVSGT